MFKKLLKILIVTFVIFGFTGCTADVSLKLDKNNNLKQTIKISEDIELLDEYNISYKKYIDEKINYVRAGNNKYKRNDFANVQIINSIIKIEKSLIIILLFILIVFYVLNLFIS